MHCWDYKPRRWSEPLSSKTQKVHLWVDIRDKHSSKRPWGITFQKWPRHIDACTVASMDALKSHSQGSRESLKLLKQMRNRHLEFLKTGHWNRYTIETFLFCFTHIIKLVAHGYDCQVCAWEASRWDIQQILHYSWKMKIPGLMDSQILLTTSHIGC